MTTFYDPAREFESLLWIYRPWYLYLSTIIWKLCHGTSWKIVDSLVPYIILMLSCWIRRGWNHRTRFIKADIPTGRTNGEEAILIKDNLYIYPTTRLIESSGKAYRYPERELGNLMEATTTYRTSVRMESAKINRLTVLYFLYILLKPI